MPLRVFPDVLVYIMERAGRREADSQPPWTRLRVNPALTSIHAVSMQMFHVGPAVGLFTVEVPARASRLGLRIIFFCFLVIPLVSQFLAAKLIYSE